MENPFASTVSSVIKVTMILLVVAVTSSGGPPVAPFSSQYRPNNRLLAECPSKTSTLSLEHSSDASSSNSIN